MQDIISSEPTLLQINVTNTGVKNYTILGMAGVLVNPNNFSQVLRNVRPTDKKKTNEKSCLLIDMTLSLNQMRLSPFLTTSASTRIQRNGEW